MTLRESAEIAMKAIEAALDGPVTDEQRDKIRVALEAAMNGAMQACCVETANVVEYHLHRRDPTLMDRINEEANARRKALISNLSVAS